MRSLIGLFLLLMGTACVGTGDRKPVSLVIRDGVTVEKDAAKINTEASILLITREAGDYNLASLYPTEYLKSKSLPALQFFTHDEILGEIYPDDQAEFIFIKDATDLNITEQQITDGELHGLSIDSTKIVNGQVWVLKKTSATASYQIIFKIIEYKVGKSLKLSYKIKELKYL